MAAGSADEITTLALYGLPPNTLRRELTNLFAFAQGFEGGCVRATHKGLMGFARFGTRAEMEAALSVVSGRVLDPGHPQPLTVTVANTQYDPSRERPRSAAGAPASSTPAVPRITIKPPNDTIYITGLTAQSTEQELTGFLAACGNLESVRWIPKASGTIAFAKFTSIPAATHAVGQLHGFALPSTAGAPLSVEYAKPMPHGR
eukprot:TRINITY_DN2636_c0_g1_i1.p1 TRINITY_DN2636_c0_g1~~TRINITY_DN2636_c0_g1_i1.p1  ORF type:complete len:203 (-),score=35.70 TRINITY_DN2636_c0_g1_i1:119-727(-)